MISAKALHSLPRQHPKQFEHLIKDYPLPKLPKIDESLLVQIDEMTARIKKAR